MHKWLIVLARAAQAVVLVLAAFGVRPAADQVAALVDTRAAAQPVAGPLRAELFESSSNRPARTRL